MWNIFFTSSKFQDNSSRILVVISQTVYNKKTSGHSSLFFGNQYTIFYQIEKKISWTRETLHKYMLLLFFPFYDLHILLKINTKCFTETFKVGIKTCKSFRRLLNWKKIGLYFNFTHRLKSFKNMKLCVTCPELNIQKSRIHISLHFLLMSLIFWMHLTTEI